MYISFSDAGVRKKRAAYFVFFIQRIKKFKTNYDQNCGHLL